jgi:hypothetical protein
MVTGMLPEANDRNPNPELQEIPLYIEDGGDGIFNGSDYALFYARGPHQWEYLKNENDTDIIITYTMIGVFILSQ